MNHFTLMAPISATASKLTPARCSNVQPSDIDRKSRKLFMALALFSPALPTDSPPESVCLGRDCVVVRPGASVLQRKLPCETFQRAKSGPPPPVWWGLCRFAGAGPLYLAAFNGSVETACPPLTRRPDPGLSRPVPAAMAQQPFVRMKWWVTARVP